MTNRMRHATVVLSLSALSIASAYADCPYPHAPGSIPDGRTATRDQMIAAQKTVKQYTADMDDYLKCMDSATPKDSDITPDMSAAQKQAITKQIQMGVEKHNAAVTDEEAMAARFNEQLKAYKAAQAAKS
jgi:hypothetical protein